jgi:hypothetical protein
LIYFAVRRHSEATDIPSSGGDVDDYQDNHETKTLVSRESFSKFTDVVDAAVTNNSVGETVPSTA